MAWTRQFDSMHANSGFTLLEMVIASGIFAAVLLVGFVTLSTSDAMGDRTEAQRTLQQANRLIFEAIAREARLAKGLIQRDQTGQVSSLPPHAPITITQGGLAAPGQPNELRTGDGLMIDTTDLTTGLRQRRVIERIEQPDDGGQVGHRLVMTVCDDPPVCAVMQPAAPLSPDGIDVVAVQFRGVSGSQLISAAPAPFIEMTITSRSTIATRAVPIVQTARTLVTIRNYPYLSQ